MAQLSPTTTRVVAVSVATSLLGLLLACGGGTPITTLPPVTSEQARFACPTNTPLPYGPAGPVKAQAAQPTAVPLGPQEYTTTYYQQWEREYGALGGPPFPAPTPYIRSDGPFHFGEIVNLSAALDVQVTAQPTAIVSGTLHLFQIEVTWQNRGQPLLLDPARQVLISAVQDTTGRQTAGAWGWTRDAAVASGTLPVTLPVTTTLQAGTGSMTLPIFAPGTSVRTLDLRFDPPEAAAETAGRARVQIVAGADPICGHPGTYDAVYSNPARPLIPPPAPANADALVATALKYVGKQYCWGGKGFAPCSGCAGGQCVTPPCAEQPCFDCSGLMKYVYQEAANVSIGAGTLNQQNYPQVNSEDIQPGDLILFAGINQHGRGSFISHVGMYGGDVTGDGTGDLIHAANYPDGVIITNNVFNNRWYSQRIALIVRPPRGGNV